MSNSIEIPFSTTLMVRDTCLCLHVQRAARALARLFDDALRPAGLTNGQFSLMMSLNRPEPPPMGPVAALLAMDQTTLTAALKPLQRKGWVAVMENPRDRRGRLLSLTADGKAALAKALPIWEKTHALLDGRLSDGGSARLRQDLQALSSMPAETLKAVASPRPSRHNRRARAE
ncbi:MarR family transcriptional regulator [Rhizobium anhuiense]|uniref:MarR family winged helix-turn-helix transcriptional regulator n=1 Tax=Rhizobium anhuiense TaxID=1184720 RepID=UPI0006466147|nr:MarR family transcriptional regulator [Rhizobium anhuiense]PDS63426.1 MarR family transcriptional regulator [Rhizobium anhuiense]